MKCKTSLMMLLVIMIAILPNLASASMRLALVIGNSGYTKNALDNPRNDAADMAAKLRRADFKVTHLQDLDRRGMARGIGEFTRRLEQTGAVGLFYYAGHGAEVSGVNYLLPLGMQVINSSELEFEAINVQRLLRQMEQARNGLNIVMIDACRNNPYRRFRGSSNTRGIQRMNAPLGSIISSSTASGEVAADGAERNSPYTKQLLAHMDLPGLSLSQFFMQVRLGVLQDTDNSQIPWETSSLTKDFYFHPEAVSTPIQTPAPVTAERPAPPRETIVVAGGIDMDSLLKECEAHFDANRLTSGIGGTALECYKEVLELRRGQPDALAGIIKIEDKYIAWARREIGQKHSKKAQSYLKRLQIINPEHEEVRELEVAIAELSRMDLPTLAATAKPAAEPSSLISGIYRDHGDGTVTDIRTGLQWMRCSLGQSWTGSSCSGDAGTYTWYEGQREGEEAAKKREGGYLGWRVPSKEELLTLVYCTSGQPALWNRTEKECVGTYQKPTINAAAFPETPTSTFWSASPYAGFSSYTWYVNFYGGYSYSYGRGSSRHVRLVRSG